MSELDEQIRNRIAKAERLVAEGVELYPCRWEHDLEPSEVESRHGERDAQELQELGLRLRVPGRVRAIRGHGKVSFLDLADGRGKLQLFVRRPELSPSVRLLLDHLDLGDLVGASGLLMRTRSGELSLQVEDLRLLAKALRPLPEKWHGLSDVEVRYRHRYLDLLVNPGSRRVFELRSRLVREIRSFLDRSGFLEVETPMMHHLPGGAVARPFTTHHNALNADLYLRIAPELFLKRLLVGGLPKVYEINRSFRNEGISTQHNPEFTMLEFYWAWVDYRRMMEFTEEMILHLAQRVLGADALTWKGQRIDLEPPWPRKTLKEALVELGGVDPESLESSRGLKQAHEERGVPLPVLGRGDSSPVEAAGQDGYGQLLMNLFEALVEEQLVQPTFILDYPVEVSPLAKQRSDDPRFVERFELYLGGMEVANAFSELNDPRVQASRFRQQLDARARGDEEAHRFDDDYIRALEHGMPPAGGEGIGVDRLVMLFADQPSIRDVILFPLLKPQEPDAPA